MSTAPRVDIETCAIESAVLDEALRLDLAYPACVAAFRRTLGEAQERIKQRFFAGTPATCIVRLRAACVDEVLVRAWRKYRLDSTPHALVAVGGYGRRELHPHSDVDIGILLGTALDPIAANRLEGLVTFLWDIGLEVGHSVRTIAQCVAAARDDITVMTNLMETRLVAGPAERLAELRAATSVDALWPADEFFKAKVREQEQRHQRYHDAFQQLEPNLKESPGGLRDIQVISWVANRHFAASSLDSLIGHGFLTEPEFRALERGRNHLWQIRCAVHYLAGRREDRLLFDHQKRVAELFGFVDEAQHRAVEAFMKGFYRTVRELSRLNEMLLGLFQEAILQRDRELRASPINRRFQVRGNYIEACNDQVFARTPPALLEIFLLMQKNPTIKGVRASTMRLIREHLHLIDDRFRRDIRARSLFMEIIRQPRRIGHELQRMHRYGVLPAYLPAFARVEGLMQFDLFHVYTVDEHLLFVVLNMRRFSYPITAADQPPLIPQIIDRLPKLELLYIAGLFHDVGKGTGRDHSEVGAEDAAGFCQIHGLSTYDTNLVVWLVRHHLVMSNTAHRKDVYDPDVIAAFAAEVGDQIRLDYLFLLTIADIRGTNPQLWNDWKWSLLSELYLATLRRLRGGAEQHSDKAERIATTKQEALKHIDSDEFSEHALALLWSTLGDAYFLRHRPLEVAWHTEAILGADEDDLPVIAVRNFENRGGTSVFVYAADMDYLFAISTATLDRLRLDVQDARIITSEAGYTLDTYTVLDAESRSAVTDPERLHEIQSRLRSAIRAREIPAIRSAPAVNRRLKHFWVPARVEFARDPAHARTVMEVIATDRPGFLSLVGRAMQNCGVRLHDARIATIGERAEDYFYITDLADRPLDDPARQLALREEILNALKS